MFLSVATLEVSEPWFSSTTEGDSMSGMKRAEFGDMRAKNRATTIIASRAASPLAAAGAEPSVCAPAASRQGLRIGSDARSPLRPAAGVPFPDAAPRARAERSLPRPRFCQDGFIGFVRAAFPASPAQHLAHLLGCPSSTAEKWLRREGAPSADYLGAMIGIFGPAFAACAIAPSPAWAVDAARAERRRLLERELEQLTP